MFNRSKSWKSQVGAAALAAGISAAVAGFSTSAQAVVITFAGWGTPSAGSTLVPFPGPLVSGTRGGEYLAPTTAADPNGITTKYLAVQQPANPGAGFGTQASPVVINFTPANVVEIYVGSLDNYNGIDIGGVDYTGIQLAALTGAVDDGSKTSHANGLFTFTFGSDVSTLTLINATKPAFEVAAIYTNNSLIPPIPEPSTWAMMVIGFLGLGFAGFRNSKKRISVASSL